MRMASTCRQASLSGSRACETKVEVRRTRKRGFIGLTLELPSSLPQAHRSNSKPNLVLVHRLACGRVVVLGGLSLVDLSRPSPKVGQPRPRRSTDGRDCGAHSAVFKGCFRRSAGSSRQPRNEGLACQFSGSHGLLVLNRTPTGPAFEAGRIGVGFKRQPMSARSLRRQVQGNTR